jgi:dCTP deaminase
MILTKEEILKEIKNKNIVIKEFNKKNLGPASYDLTLDNKFRFFDEKTININNKTDYKKHTKLKKLKKISLLPNEFILGITKEQIKLSNDVCAFLSGRTRFARLGLAVHITANFVNPATNNKQVLEIKNMSNDIITIEAGTKICQIIFARTSGKTKNKGKFTTQKSF